MSGKKYFRAVTAVLWIGLIISWPGPLWAAPAPVGTVDETAGPVQVKRLGTAGFSDLSAGAEIYASDTIQTGDGGRVRLVFNDQSVVSVGAGTTLTVSQYVFDPKKKKRTSVFTLLKGKAKLFVADLVNWRSKRFEVTTRTAVIGVRGTVFLVWVMGPDNTGICALDKSVEAATVATPSRKTVLEPGTFTHVMKGKAPDVPEKVPDEVIEKIHTTLFESDRGLAPGVIGGK